MTWLKDGWLDRFETLYQHKLLLIFILLYCKFQEWGIFFCLVSFFSYVPHSVTSFFCFSLNIFLYSQTYISKTYSEIFIWLYILQNIARILDNAQSAKNLTLEWVWRRKFSCMFCNKTCFEKCNICVCLENYFSLTSYKQTFRHWAFQVMYWEVQRKEVWIVQIKEIFHQTLRKLMYAHTNMHFFGTICWIQDIYCKRHWSLWSRFPPHLAFVYIRFISNNLCVKRTSHFPIVTFHLFIQFNFVINITFELNIKPIVYVL